MCAGEVLWGLVASLGNCMWLTGLVNVRASPQCVASPAACMSTGEPHIAWRRLSNLPRQPNARVPVPATLQAHARAAAAGLRCGGRGRWRWGVAGQQVQRAWSPVPAAGASGSLQGLLRALLECCGGGLVEGLVGTCPPDCSVPTAAQPCLRMAAPDCTALLAAGVAWRHCRRWLLPGSTAGGWLQPATISGPLGRAPAFAA